MLIGSSTPLIITAHIQFDPIAVIVPLLVGIVGIGALISIRGSDEFGTIGKAQLMYATALDGFLPHSLIRGSEFRGRSRISLTSNEERRFPSKD